MRRWFEPLDLPLLLSQTNVNRSPAPAHAHVDSSTQDMVVQCDAGGLHKSDLIPDTYEVVISSAGCDGGLSRLIYLDYCLLFQTKSTIGY
jgi:hypothetical protein